MGAAVDEAALAICVRQTLKAFLPAHKGLEEAGVEVVEIDGRTLIDIDGYGFNVILEPGPGIDDTDDAVESARLLADAAPDLLDALTGAKEVIRQLLRNHTHSMPEGFYENQEAIAVAIAKAEGAA